MGSSKTEVTAVSVGLVVDGVPRTATVQEPDKVARLLADLGSLGRSLRSLRDASEPKDVVLHVETEQ